MKLNVKSASSPQIPRFDRVRVLVLSLGHLITDSYANVIPPILPILKEAYGLSYAASGTIMAAFTVTSSIIQPIFGYISDRYGKRYMVALSVLWAGFFTSLIGLLDFLQLDSTGASMLILALVAVAGLGYAAYHPQASALVPRVSGNSKGFGVSLFSAGGNLGYAIMPLIIVWLVKTWGFKSALLLLIPGIIMAALLQRYAPERAVQEAKVNAREIVTSIQTVARPLGLVTSVVCMRVWLFTGLITFLPLYLAWRGESPESAGLRLFILLAFGAAGTLLGGYASDRCGRKAVIVVSMAATGPLLLAALLTDGALSWMLTAAAGLVMLASFSPAVLIAQGLIPKSQGIASSIILGLAFGLGGLGVAITGIASDRYGIATGTYSLIMLPAVGFLLALLLPGTLVPGKAR